MGRERSRKMEHLLLYIACSVIILKCFLGCSYVSSQRYTQGVLKSAAATADEGDITGALQQNEMALKEYPCRLSDQALFQRGLFLSHPSNSKQNYREAAQVFQKLMTDFPDSELEFEAEIWLKTLERMLQKKHTIEELKKKINTQIKITTQLKEHNATRQLEIEKLIQQVAQLEGQIDKLKKVDLGIELEKRKTVSQ